MASWYIWNGATGTGSGADWTNAFTTLAAAIAAGAAGDTYYVASDHTETGAANTAISYTFKGTSANQAVVTFDKLLCVNRAGSFPPVAADLTTGAQISSNGTGRLNIYGCVYCYGVTFSCGTSGFFELANTYQVQTYESCLFVFGSGTSVSRFGSDNSRVRLINSRVTFNGASNAISLQGAESSIEGPSNATFVTAFVAGYANNIFGGSSTVSLTKPTIRGCDFSNAPSGSFLAVYNVNAGFHLTRFVNCKLPTAGTIFGSTGGTSFVGSGRHEFIGCDTAAGGSVNRHAAYTIACWLTTETTIKRTGGASDGVVSYSWKLVPQNSMSSFDMPFDTFEGQLWNDTIGSPLTLTVHLVTDNLALNNDEIWLEVEYLGTSGQTIASKVSTAPANRLTANAALPSDSATAWTTTGLTTPNKQKLVATFTPLVAGPIRWRVRYARASGTVYVCPRADLA